MMRFPEATLPGVWRVAVVPALVFGLACGAAARSNQLTSAFTFPVLKTASDVDVEKAVRRALMGRHWRILHYAPHDIEARIFWSDNRSATIDVTWSASQVSMSYVTSENLDYEVDDGKRYINHSYFRWLEYLKHDTYVFLTRGFGRPVPDLDENGDVISDPLQATPGTRTEPGEVPASAASSSN